MLETYDAVAERHLLAHDAEHGVSYFDFLGGSGNRPGHDLDEQVTVAPMPGLVLESETLEHMGGLIHAGCTSPLNHNIDITRRVDTRCVHLDSGTTDHDNRASVTLKRSV
jgi:hypothetical protein